VWAASVSGNHTNIPNPSPAVSDGQIFLRSDKFAYCFGKK